MAIEFDYSNYKYKAKKKYDYVKKKYNYQISNKKIDPKYEIEMTFAVCNVSELISRVAYTDGLAFSLTNKIIKPNE